mmetsp:Transcript_2582/g.5107  ORF Transcript_2582/g.5107 Transcript_2582/m.5107 type:complete len:168 (+) Transcript_2582:80-583(+)
MLLLLSLLASAHGSDICGSGTGFSGAEQAVVCYTGNFLTKMLTELDAGNNKTAEHVRVHLLPYLGGSKTLDALIKDDPSDPTCKVCYKDNSTFTGLSGLRESLSAEQISAYDSVNVCYARLTESIMASLPKSPCGVWLKAIAMDPYDQVVSMMKQIFAIASSASLCP